MYIYIYVYVLCWTLFVVLCSLTASGIVVSRFGAMLKSFVEPWATTSPKTSCEKSIKKQHLKNQSP